LIRVSVVARSPVVQAGLRSLLEEGPGIEVVDTLAPSSADDAKGEVIVFDAEPDGLPAMDIEGAAIVLLSDDADAVRQSELWPSRVRAILPHSAPVAEILVAVQAVAVGFVLLRPEEAERAHVPPRAGSTVGETLTPRELEVMQMIAAGESNKRIAWKLGISEHTVKFHVASILSKLSAASRAEAVAIGMRRGLIYL
jgi:two-component system, NarL family, response regulator YdfI